MTGCDSGLGYGTAIELHKRGYQVIAGCYTANGARKIQEEADAITKARGSTESSDLATNLHTVQLDVTSEESIQAAIRCINAIAPSGVDVLVNNAGTMAGANLVEFTPIGTYQQMMDVNFFGIVRVCQAILPLMKQRAADGKRARIVNVSSFLGRVRKRRTMAIALIL